MSDVKTIDLRSFKGSQFRLVIQGMGGSSPTKIHPLTTIPMALGDFFKTPAKGELWEYHDDECSVKGNIHRVGGPVKLAGALEGIVEIVIVLSPFEWTQLPKYQREEARYKRGAQVMAKMPQVIIIDQGRTRRALGGEPFRISGPLDALEELAQFIQLAVDAARKGPNGINWLPYTWVEVGSVQGLRPLLDTFPSNWDDAGHSMPEFSNYEKADPAREEGKPV